MSSDEIVSRNPVDRTAALVTGPGEHYVAPRETPNQFWESPPGCVPIPKRPEGLLQIRNLIGTRCDRMEVVGFLGFKEGNPTWLVRCDCGLYESRNGITWRQALLRNRNQLCFRCEHLQVKQQSVEAKHASAWRYSVVNSILEELASQHPEYSPVMRIDIALEILRTKLASGNVVQTPPECVPFHNHHGARRLDNFIGTRRGKMQIVGFLGIHASNKGPKWLAKCDCGNHESRNGDSWRRGLLNGSHDHCKWCGILSSIRNYLLGQFRKDDES